MVLTLVARMNLAGRQGPAVMIPSTVNVLPISEMFKFEFGPLLLCKLGAGELTILGTFFDRLKLIRKLKSTK